MSLNRNASSSSSSHSAAATPSKQERKAQPNNAFLLRIPSDVMEDRLSHFMTTQEVVRLSTSSAHLHSTYQRDLNKRALQQLLQAVVDDDRERAKRIVDSNPELLLIEPATENVTEIESKHTFQRFCTEKALVMAQNLHRLEITKILLSAFEKLEGQRDRKATHLHDGKSELQTQWVLPPYDEAKQKIHNEKLQQKYIDNYLTPVADTIVANKCTENQFVAFINDTCCLKNLLRSIAILMRSNYLLPLIKHMTIISIDSKFQIDSTKL
jgi:hypothetical protein